MSVVYFGIGSNEGNKLLNLVKAMKAIGVSIGNVLDFSPVFQSEAWGYKSDAVYYNQVLKVETQFTAFQTLRKLQAVELSLGRIREHKGYADRIIDIDLLLFGDNTISCNKLVVPHPLMLSRQFVMQPLCTIAPDLIHPIEKKSIHSLALLCNDTSEIEVVMSQQEFKNYYSCETNSETSKK